MSSGAIVLPSFNRFYSQSVTHSPSGLIAYACRNIIYFIDARSYPPVVLDSKCIREAYKEKIAGISYCKCENTDLIASISDCGEVKIWDVNTRTSVKSYTVNEGISNIEWIAGSSNTVVFLQDSKVLIKWNFSTNYATKIKLGAELKTCFITSNEKCPHLLAVGHNNGTITVLDIVQEKILQRFRDHTREINVLTWSPVLPDTLISVSSDYSARYWKMGEDKSTKLFWIGRAKPEDRKRIRVIGICHPKEADVMICSNPYGEIGEVTLSDDRPRFKPYCKTIPEVNCRCLFALFSTTVKIEQGEVDYLYCFDIYVFSVWNITKKNVVFFLPFFMGFVYDLSFSPVNPIYLSISNGDGFVRVWNAQSDSQTSRMISVFIQARTKIMTASWHPTLENIIAFGTDDGKLGIIDTFKKRSRYPFETFHKGKVYSVCWGPYKATIVEDAESDKYVIYSCGGGSVYINRLQKLNEPALNFNDVATLPDDMQIVENNSNEIAWKPDYSCVCIGTYQGFIDVYSDTLVFLNRCNLEMKSIEHLKWHPESTYMSPSGSPFKFWLACSGNDTSIYVVDTSKIFEKKSENNTDWVVKKLIGHKKHINGTCWNPHMDGYLVSASKDGSALVWNVCTGDIIVSFLNHYDVVNTVQWSAFDDDIIYSGGQDNFVRVWKISDQRSVAPADKTPHRKKLRKSKLLSKSLEKLQDSEDENLPENENNTLENGSTIAKTSKANLNKDKLAEIVEIEDFDQNETAVLGNVKHVDRSTWEGRYDQALWLCQKARKISLFKDCFKSVTKDEGMNDCMKLADICKGTEEVDESFDPSKPMDGTLTDEDVLKFGLYTDQITALRMADVQADSYKLKNETRRYCQVSIMANKTQTLIKEATENGTLSSYLVSLAPSVSYSFWLETCEKYAIQLMQKQQPYVACNYFLMCNKVYEAINVLVDKGKTIDALALAKLRLPESDPVISNILQSIRWKYKNVSNSLGEVKCYLGMNEPLSAIKTLGSMPDAGYVKVAAYIAQKYNMKYEAEKYCFIFMQKCLMQCDWESFREFANQEPSLQGYSILFAVHEAFYAHLRGLKKKSGIFLKEIFSLTKSEELFKFWNGVICVDSDKIFMEHVCDILASKNLLPTDVHSLRTIIKLLDTFSSKWDVLESSSEAHVAIAIYITKFILLASIGDSAAATANFLQIFKSSCNIVFLPKIVFMLFFPVDLLWSQNEKTIICQNKVDNLASNKNMVLTQYQQIVECFSQQTMIKSHPFNLAIISRDSLENELHSVTERIAAALSLKDCSEFILAYFVSYLVHDLSRLVDKKVLALECHAEKLNKESCKTGAEVFLESNIIDENSNTDKTEIQKDNLSELEVLLEVALKEADEKIKILTNSSESIPPDASYDSSQIAVKPDLCSNEEFSNDKTICDGQVNKNIDNEDGSVLKDDCCVEISSTEIESKNETCDARVYSCDDSHVQCLDSIDLFYHMILFVMSNLCKEEFSLLYYLKERLKFLHLAKASHELSKLSKGNKSELSSEIKETISPTKAKEPKIKTGLFLVVQSDKSVDELHNTNNNHDKVSKDTNDSEHYDLAVESVSQGPNDDKSEFSNLIFTNEVHLNDNEIASIISNDPINDYSSSLKDFHCSREILGAEYKSKNNSGQISDEHVLKELIDILELKTKGISYPNPLDIVPKVLDILYEVRQKFTCSFIQEKLHVLIDEIVHWAGTFQVANINFVCAICN